MEMQTSDEAYQLYRTLKDREERVNKQNKGLSLYTSENVESSYFISVLKKVEINLLEKQEEVIVETNLFDWRHRRYGEDFGIDEFLDKLKEYLLTPSYKFLIQHNRRRENKVDVSWKANFRKKDFEFEEIKITIGKEAKSYVDSLGFDFVGTIKKIVGNKKEPTEKEKEDFEMFSYLYNRKDDLMRQLKSIDYSYSSYGQPKDYTLKISISNEEYNKKLKEVEEGLLKLCKKYSFLEMPRIDYKEINVRKSFEDWRVCGEVDMQDDWGYLDDDEKEEYEGDFENYLKQFYEQYLEDNDFDE